MRITTLGEAMQDGQAGQIIQVRNVESKKIVLGKVVAASLVEVDY